MRRFRKPSTLPSGPHFAKLIHRVKRKEQLERPRPSTGVSFIPILYGMNGPATFHLFERLPSHGDIVNLGSEQDRVIHATYYLLVPMLRILKSNHPCLDFNITSEVCLAVDISTTYDEEAHDEDTIIRSIGSLGAVLINQQTRKYLKAVEWNMAGIFDGTALAGRMLQFSDLKHYGGPKKLPIL